MATTKRMKTIFVHNRVLVTAYTVPSIPVDKLRCRHKGGHSSPAQKKYNRKKSLERIVLKAQNTFETGCFFVIYTYDDDNLPSDSDIAYKDLINTVRATKRLFQQNGLSVCPYIASVEQGEKHKRLHCHALYPYTRTIDIEKIKAKWKKGKVMIYIIPVSQIENRVMYVFKAPLRQSVSKAFNMPVEVVRDISEAEYKKIVDNPLLIENALQGFEVFSIDEITVTGWVGFKKVKIYLKKSKVCTTKNNFLEKGEMNMFNTA